MNSRIYLTINHKVLPWNIGCMPPVAFIYVVRYKDFYEAYLYAPTISTGVEVSGGEEVFDHEIFNGAIMLKDFDDDACSAVISGIITRDDVARVAKEDGLDDSKIDEVLGNIREDLGHWEHTREYIAGSLEMVYNRPSEDGV